MMMSARNMRAVVVRQFGGLEVLKVETDVPVPAVGDNQVLVKVHAAGVNPVDTYIRAGNYGILPSLPFTPGKDSAGIVEKVGNNVTNVKPGQRVFTSMRGISGAYAEFSLIDSSGVFPLGDKLTFQQGAAIGAPYFTAFRALVQKGAARAGQTVLVHGASGAVGNAAVQIAKTYGLKVFGTAGSEEGARLVKKWGAEKVFNHREKDYIKDILAATEGQGVDIVLEMIANINLQNDMDLVKKGGRVVVIGSRGTVEVNPRSLMVKESMVIGVGLFAVTDEEWLEIGSAITAGIETGWVQPHVGKEYNLEDAGKAHDEVINTTSAQGKIVLVI